MLCCLLESTHLSKSALKNKKRAEKRTKARIEQIKENGGTLEAIEMKDPVAVLREQLQEAKDNKVSIVPEWLNPHGKKYQNIVDKGKKSPKRKYQGRNGVKLRFGGVTKGT